MKSVDREALARILGFRLEFVIPSTPQVRFYDAEGKVTSHCRPANPAEVRMWCLLTREHHEATTWPVETEVRSKKLKDVLDLLDERSNDIPRESHN